MEFEVGLLFSALTESECSSGPGSWVLRVVGDLNAVLVSC